MADGTFLSRFADASRASRALQPPERAQSESTWTGTELPGWRGLSALDVINVLGDSQTTNLECEMADQDAKLADATTKTDVDSQIEETLIEEVSIDGMCGVY